VSLPAELAAASLAVQPAVDFSIPCSPGPFAPLHCAQHASEVTREPVVPRDGVVPGDPSDISAVDRPLLRAELSMRSSADVRSSGRMTVAAAFNVDSDGPP
jgi:hypothetical protein